MKDKFYLRFKFTGEISNCQNCCTYRYSNLGYNENCRNESRGIVYKMGKHMFTTIVCEKWKEDK